MSFVYKIIDSVSGGYTPADKKSKLKKSTAGTSKTRVQRLRKPFALALDWDRRHLYWTDTAGGYLGVADFVKGG